MNLIETMMEFLRLLAHASKDPITISITYQNIVYTITVSQKTK